MYKYSDLRKATFTEEGQVLLLAIRDHVQRCLKLSGAVTMGSAMEGARAGAPDTWTMMACVDRLAELGELREVDQGRDVHGQDRIFVSGRAS